MKKENNGFEHITLEDIGALTKVSLSLEDSVHRARMVLSRGQLQSFVRYPNGNYLHPKCIESRRVLGEKEAGYLALTPDGTPIVYGILGDFQRTFFFQIGNGPRYQTELFQSTGYSLFLAGFSEGKPVVLAKEFMHSMDADMYPSMWEHSRTRRNVLLHGETIVMRNGIESAFVHADSSVIFFVQSKVENKYDSWSWKAGKLVETAETWNPENKTFSHIVGDAEIVFTKTSGYKFEQQVMVDGKIRTLPFKKLLDIRNTGNETWIVFTNGHTYNVQFNIAPLAKLVEYLQSNPEPKKGRENYNYMNSFSGIVTVHNWYDGRLTQLADLTFAYQGRVFLTESIYEGSSMFWTTQAVRNLQEVYLPDATELVEEQGRFYYYSLVGKHLLKFEL